MINSPAPRGRPASREVVRRRHLLALFAAATASRPAGAAPRRLTLAWRHAAAPDVAVLVARDQGLFASLGLDVALVPTGGAALADALRGGADACVGPALDLLVPLKDGLDARLVTGVDGGGLRLLAEKKSGLRHIEDLKGKRLGVGRLDGAAKLFFSIMLRRKGIDPYKEIGWIEVEPAGQGDALRARTIDAVAVSDAHGFFLREALKLTEIATNLSGSYRDRTSSVLACSGRLIRETPAAAASLAGAIRQAAAWVAAHPEDAAPLARSLGPDALSDQDVARMLRQEAPGEHPEGAALIEDVAAYADELRLLGLFPYDLNAGRYAESVCLRTL